MEARWPQLLLVLGFAFGVPVGFALSQTANFHVDERLQMTTTEIPEPTNVRVHEDRWEPGAETGPHDHPGPAILAVLEGELLEHTSAGNIVLRAGEVVWRPARQHHNVKNVSGAVARVLAIHWIRCLEPPIP